MENYREKLKIQNVFIAVCCLVLLSVSVLGSIGVLKPVAGDAHWVDFWNGFMTGASFGVLAWMIFALVRNILALRSEKKLKKLYVKEHDERMAQIYIYARSAGMQMFLLLGLVAIIVAGYFSIAVSLTILGCVLAGSFLSAGFKFYYQKKF